MDSFRRRTVLYLFRTDTAVVSDHKTLLFASVLFTNYSFKFDLPFLQFGR
jgi:hypothetical protein